MNTQENSIFRKVSTVLNETINVKDIIINDVPLLVTEDGLYLHECALLGTDVFIKDKFDVIEATKQILNSLEIISNLFPESQNFYVHSAYGVLAINALLSRSESDNAVVRIGNHTRSYDSLRIGRNCIVSRETIDFVDDYKISVQSNGDPFKFVNSHYPSGYAEFIYRHASQLMNKRVTSISGDFESIRNKLYDAYSKERLPLTLETSLLTLYKPEPNFQTVVSSTGFLDEAKRQLNLYNGLSGIKTLLGRVIETLGKYNNGTASEDKWKGTIYTNLTEKKRHHIVTCEITNVGGAKYILRVEIEAKRGITVEHLTVKKIDLHHNATKRAITANLDKSPGSMAVFKCIENIGDSIVAMLFTDTHSRLAHEKFTTNFGNVLSKCGNAEGVDEPRVDHLVKSVTKHSLLDMFLLSNYHESIKGLLTLIRSGNIKTVVTSVRVNGKKTEVTSVRVLGESLLGPETPKGKMAVVYPSFANQFDDNGMSNVYLVDIK